MGPSVTTTSQSGRIVVEKPRAGEQITDVVEVAGLSDTYEATVVIQVKDGNGAVLARTHAQGGMMGLAPFEARVVLDRRPALAEGWIEVLELGGKDSDAGGERALVPIRFDLS